MSQDQSYFEFDRPELRALVPAEARRVLDVGCGADPGQAEQRLSAYQYLLVARPL